MRKVILHIWFIMLIVYLGSCQKGTKDPTEYTVQKRLDNGDPIPSILKTYQPYHLLGKYTEGGRIFYLDVDHGQGMVVADVNVSEGTQWGCSGLNIPGADGFEIGDGKNNTKAIVSDCPFPGTAADLCWNWEYNGYTDWFLPSAYEFFEILRVFPSSTDSICSPSTQFWTSTNKNTVQAYTFSCDWEFETTEYKTFEAKVRAIRKFTF